MPKVRYNFVIDPDALKHLRKIKERVGISESEQIRRGVWLWLRSQGITIDKKKKR